MITKKDLIKLNDYLWEIPKSYRKDMRVPARIYVSEKMLDKVFKDKTLEQLTNVTTLPGIVKCAVAMPEAHEGYGQCIGGIFASDPEKGIISPGACGYDINCGVRLLTSKLSSEEIQPYLNDLANQIQRDIPSGVGRGGNIRLDRQSMDKILKLGVKAITAKGVLNESANQRRNLTYFAKPEDLEKIEAQGSLESADPKAVSDRAKKRGSDQLGTLGSGNHFLEIQKVERIYDQKIAQVFGLKESQVTFMIHTGSRGLGHQVCTDYVRIMMAKLLGWGISLPDRELACAPLNTKEGKDYFRAMCAAANFAWANRQVITYLVRDVWERILGKGKELNLLYDVAHNIVKVEEHQITEDQMKNPGHLRVVAPSGRFSCEITEPASVARIATRPVPSEARDLPRNDRLCRNDRLWVHRKGATRAFPAGHSEVPEIYRQVGQPVLIPGSMGTASYVLVGTQKAMQEAFGSTCHGSGRRFSRTKAKKTVCGADLKKELEARGIIIRCASTSGLAEEAPQAYKDVDEVVDVVAQAGLAHKVARLVPLAVVKGE